MTCRRERGRDVWEGMNGMQVSVRGVDRTIGPIGHDMTDRANAAGMA